MTPEELDAIRARAILGSEERDASEDRAALLAHIAALEAEGRALRAALQLPLLFHAGGPWERAMAERWFAITGKDEATSKVMCDHIRATVAPGGPE